MTQLEDDLLKNARERLDLWIKDTVMRCRAVDVPVDVVISILGTCLIWKLMSMAHHFKFDLNELVRTAQKAIKPRRNSDAI